MVKKKPKKFLRWDCKNHHSLMCESFKHMSVPTRMFCICIDQWLKIENERQRHTSLHLPNKPTPPYTNSSGALT